MPPRTARKSSIGSAGAKKTVPRVTRSVTAAQKPEEMAVEVVEAADASLLEATLPTQQELMMEVKAPIEVEYEDCDKVEHRGSEDERLDLEGTEAEYEVEEAGVDYDENDLGLEHDEREELEGVDYIDEGDDVEEEVDIGDDNADGDGQDAEDEDDENAEEEAEVDVEEEHHEVFKEHRKRKEYEVFVGGLDKDATEDDLREVFGGVGEIIEVRLMINSFTRKNKGFAFLRYATVEQAKRAVSELQNPVVRGKQCGVAPSQDNDTLFVGNICKTWTKEHLVEKLKSFGVENFEGLTLIDDSNNKGMNRGFALVEFLSRSEAMDAYRRLRKSDVNLGLDKPAKVSFADNFIEPDDEIMKQVRTIFVDGLPASWDEDRVREQLKIFGVVEKVELARNMPAAKRKDFGFVTFDTHENAVACAEAINNTELCEGDGKVTVRCRLSRPDRKPRMKPGLHNRFRSGRAPLHGSRLSYPRPLSHKPLLRPSRPIMSRLSDGSHGLKRPLSDPVSFRNRRPVMMVMERSRRVPTLPRSHDRKPLPVPLYTRSSTRRAYGRDDVPFQKSKPAGYSSRAPVERSIRDDYSSRGATIYTDVSPRSMYRVSDRRAYVDDSYVGRVERTLPAYVDERDREYYSMSGSKRAYADMDNNSRYPEASVRKPRVSYDMTSSARYSDAYDERVGRSHVDYVSSRPVSSQDGFYGSRHGMSYSRGSVSGSDVRRIYSSSSSGYPSRSSDVAGGSYSSLYSNRSIGSNRGYYSGSGSGSYY